MMILLFLVLFCARALSERFCPDLPANSPCYCSSTMFEPVVIVCEQVQRVENLRYSLGIIDVEIDSLTIRKTPMSEVPPFFLYHYKVRRLVLNRNSIRSIHPEAFSGAALQTLEELDLRYNELGRIPISGVSRLMVLKSLLLARNHIAFLEPQAFNSYISSPLIQRLDLSDNQISTIPPDAFVDLASLYELNLDKNLFKEMPIDGLRTLRYTLQDLSLNINNISIVPPATIDFPSLSSLGLEVNAITSIPQSAFIGTPNLVYLYLSNNRLSYVNPRIFQPISTSLKVLTLSHNPLGNVPSDTFTYTPYLVRLELADCQIQSLDAGLLQKTSKLQVMLLNENQLEQINFGTFQGLTQLSSIDLSSNRISIVENGSFSNLRMLRHLDLSRNSLSTLLPTVFQDSLVPTNPVTARILYLYDNTWLCDDTFVAFRAWLRQNGDIVIDPPGNEPTAVCDLPEELNGLGLRQQQQPWARPPKPAITVTPSFLQNEGEVVTTISAGVNTAGLVLAIVMALFLLVIVLMLVLRYWMSRQHRLRKEEAHEFRRLGVPPSQITAGYQPSSYGSYSSQFSHQPLTTISGQRVPFQQDQRGYVLNKPWYYWF